MQKSDKIYLSKFALNPDTEYLDLENYDFGYDEEIDRFIIQLVSMKKENFSTELKL